VSAAVTDDAIRAALGDLGAAAVIVREDDDTVTVRILDRPISNAEADQLVLLLPPGTRLATCIGRPYTLDADALDTGATMADVRIAPEGATP
jgi:hypothetical protein